MKHMFALSILLTSCGDKTAHISSFSQMKLIDCENLESNEEEAKCLEDENREPSNE